MVIVITIHIPIPTPAQVIIPNNLIPISIKNIINKIPNNSIILHLQVKSKILQIMQLLSQIKYKQIPRLKVKIPTNGAGKTGYAQAKKKSDPYFIPYMKANNAKSIKDLNITLKILKLLEENMGKEMGTHSSILA